MGWSAARFQTTVADESGDLCVMCEDRKGAAELLGGHGGDGRHAGVHVSVRAATIIPPN